MYTLILTMSNENGVFIHSITGFESKSAADTAGNAWKDSAPVWGKAWYNVAKMG